MNIKKTKLLLYLPHHIKSYGIGYAANSLAMGMSNGDMESDIFSIRSDYKRHSSRVIQAYKSDIFYKLSLKIFGQKKLILKTEKKFKRIIKNYDVSYLWPGCSLETYQYLKKIGKIIVVENINCHQQTSREILDQEAENLKVKTFHSITDEKIEDENAKLALADFIFSPSPQVTKSLIRVGIDSKKIIESSYGLETKDFLVNSPLRNNDRSFTALFVGSVIPRKGIHLLLDYWKEARIDNGLLKVIGKIDSSAREIVDKYHDDPSIQFISFTNDLQSHYQSADLFMMPSLEEGSPLVTYLAIGAGLPCLVSPMAGDGVIRHGYDGYVIPPHDKNDWVKTLQKIASQPELRATLSNSVFKHAENFLWPVVAQKRTLALLNRLKGVK